MKELAIEWRGVTGYTVRGSLVLTVAGFWLILFTFPNFFYTLSTQGLPLGMGWIIDSTRNFSGRIAELQNDTFLESLRSPLVVALPYFVVVLAVAALFRSVRAKSVTPTFSMGANLGLGILAFPLFAWVAQLVVWVIGVAGVVASWVAGLASNGVVRIIGLAFLGLLVLGVAIALVWWAAKSPRARWIIMGAVVAITILFLVRDSLAALFGPTGAAIAGFFGILGGGLSTAGGFVGSVLVGALLWFLALVVLAYLGSTLWTPIRDAWGAGRQSDRLADVSAGVGVAISTMITAAAYNGEFHNFMLAAANSRSVLPLGSIPNVLDLQFGAIMPHGFDPIMTALFRGFNGAPDLLVIALACVIGVASLIFTAGPLAPAERPATILTAGFLRVGLVMVGVLLVLLLTSFDPT